MAEERRKYTLKVPRGGQAVALGRGQPPQQQLSLVLRQIVEEEAKKEFEENKRSLAALDALDTDDENDEEEYEAWKVRELKRIKRDREEREA